MSVENVDITILLFVYDCGTEQLLTDRVMLFESNSQGNRQLLIQNVVLYNIIV